MKFILNEDNFVIEEEEKINSGSFNYYEVEVEYDESWKDLIIKAVLIKAGEREGQEIAVIGNRVYIDQKKYGDFSIGFVGYTLEDEEAECPKKIYQISTRLQSIYIKKGAGSIKAITGRIPTASEWEVYIAQIQDLIKGISRIPTGGTEGQTLAKNSDEDYDYKWQDSVISINEKTGEVILKVSDLENDAGYLTEESDPTVPEWAKEPEKPSYDVSEIEGAISEEELTHVVEEIDGKIEDVKTIADGKVDKIEGKGLSQNDFTNDYREKLDSLHNYDDTDLQNQINQVNELAEQNERDITNLGNNVANLENETAELQSNKVDKEAGKSLISDSEIDRLKNVKNYDDSDVRNQINQVNELAEQNQRDITNLDNEVTAISEELIEQEETLNHLADTKQDKLIAGQNITISEDNVISATGGGGGGGAVDSVNGKTGVVVLKTSDIENNSGYITKDVDNLENYYKKTETFTTTEATELLENYATVTSLEEAKATLNQAIETKQPIGDYALKNEIPDVSEFIKNTVDNLVNYYKKSETYTQVEVNQLIGAIKTVSMKVVPSRPEVGESNIIYLVPSAKTETENVYDEWIYVDNKWELIGNTKVDLTNYYTKEQIATLLYDYITSTDLEQVVNDLETEITNKTTVTMDDVNYTVQQIVDKIYVDKQNVLSDQDKYALVKNALVNNTIALTDEEKLKIETWLGLSENYLTYYNETPYNVDSDYNPAHKKYVDDEAKKLDARIDEIELFKFPNVTIFGEPTIQQGQVSNFSNTNYLEFPFIVDFRRRSFEINFAFTTGQDIINQQNILDSDFGLAFAIRNRHLVLALSYNGTSWATEQTGTMTLEAQKSYRIKISWTGLVYRVQYSEDGGKTYIDDITFGGASYPYPKQMYIGVGKLAQNHFEGIINLNYANVFVEGQLIWQGMDDAGLATRADINLENITSVAEQRIKNISYIPVIENANVTVLEPNKYYKWGEVTSLDLTLGTPIDGIYNEYMFEFISGATPTTLTLPDTVKWETTPDIEANKTYQISIVNNIALVAGV